MKKPLTERKTFVITDIDWDIDDDLDPETLNLPERLVYVRPQLFGENETSFTKEELIDRIAELTSKRFGFCMNGFVINE